MSLPVLHVVVPVLNEAPNLERLISDIASMRDGFNDAYDLRFLLVDDGSTDGSGEIATRLGAEKNLEVSVVRHEINLGPGKAFASAFSRLAPILGPGDWVLTLEGDNTSRLELVRQMFTRTQEGYDVILASPYMYGGGVTNTQTIRLFLSFMANLFVKEALGISGIMTASSFFRLYRASVILRLGQVYGDDILERTGFESMLEMLMKMIMLGTTISEVPMVLDTSRRLGKSKMKLGKTIFGYLALWSGKAGWRARATAVDM